MEETMKIAAVVGLAVLMGLIGMKIKGVFGAVMGFILTLLVIALFVIFKKDAEG